LRPYTAHIRMPARSDPTARADSTRMQAHKQARRRWSNSAAQAALPCRASIGKAAGNL
jgi:hypothetical protein